jgi:hypothetical protein
MLLRIAAVATLSLAASLLPAALAPLGGAKCRGEGGIAGAFGDAERTKTIFFGVLEGLYESGLSNEAVDLILADDPQTRRPANFVWACPVCMPAYEAFRVYRTRPEFTTVKGGGDTFGAGLDGPSMDTLRSADVAARQKAIESLVQRWIGRRLERMRFTESELAEWRQDMELRRKKGMALLQSYQQEGAMGSYASMKTCPFCEAANGACKAR